MRENTFDDETFFENEVRRIARELWPSAQYDGQRMIEDRERDGVFETEDCIHLVEATVSRQKAKAETDIKKLVSLAGKFRQRQSFKAIKCWFITKEEPTADQREVASRYRDIVVALRFSQFQSKIIDADSYLSLREKYPFGSVRDPATDTPYVNIEYVPLDLIESGIDRLWSVANIRDELMKGGRFIVLGDYGAGKSMTLRELNKELKQTYLKQRSSRFPIYLNLRDHMGQTNPAEILERHGRNIGFPNPSHLVRAWRTGYAILLLDGFDELTTLGIQGLWRRLQDSRYRAMQAIREFIKGQPREAGVVLAGRAHFFDTDRERKNAFGLYPESDYVELTLNEFTDEQVQRYLMKCGFGGKVPEWMPSRPLLVGYLAARGVLAELFNEDGNGQRIPEEPSLAWDMVLDRICGREAEIEAGIDGPTVRRILERLATRARATSGGLGGLSVEIIVQSFYDICGYSPDEKGMVLLQRLPGLGIDRADEGTRTFIDDDFADTCRSGDVVAFINDPYSVSIELFRKLDCGLDMIGVNVTNMRCRRLGVTRNTLNAALRQSAANIDTPYLSFDVSRVAISMNYAIDVSVVIKDVYIPAFELYRDVPAIINLCFRNCYFSVIDVDTDADGSFLPRFVECYIDEIVGRSSASDLPAGVFDTSCTFDTFSEAPETTDAIGSMNLPLGVRVLLTILKKIYLQRGSGRRENALYRGLDHRGRRIVPDVLHLLHGEGLVSPSKYGGVGMTIWLPDKKKATRARKIITSPHTCGDVLVQRASELS